MTVTNFEFGQQRRREWCREDAINIFTVRPAVIESVMLVATVVHCTLIKHRENLICSLVFLTFI